jgi:hypothetical protein
MKIYTVFKRTGTHADALAAIGAADVLRYLEPRIVECNDRFEIRLRRKLGPSDLEGVDPGFSYLELAGKKQPILPAERIVCVRASEDGQQDENRMYAILRRMKAYGGPNKVVLRFAQMSRDLWTRRVWESLHGRTDFVFSSPLVQLFNPHAAKGYAMLKPAGTNRSDRTKDRWAESFVEWLRFRGYFEGAAGWFTSGDLQVYCPIPADIPYDRFASVAASFRDLKLGGTAAKMDCRAVLALTRLLIQSTAQHRRPARSLSGLWATHYKDMGQAHTFMAMDRLAVPDWFEAQTEKQQQLWFRALDEHDRALRRLNDSHSDEFALLKQYRRTFQTRSDEALGELIEFLAGYATILFRRRSRDEWSLPQFTASIVVPILRRDPAFYKMLRNGGFLAVAAAVRSSTVGAQAARYNGDPDHREIRYGLLGDIRRAGALGKRELWERVAAFILEFNREGVRRHASKIPSALIRASELDSFEALLGHLPSNVPAGSILCAFSACLPGTAVAPKVEQVAQTISA